MRRATGAERDQALFFDGMDRKLPVGLSRDGEPLYVNLEFLDGTRGAHVNISGISGVATKTSYATFLLYSLFRSGVLGAEAANTKALIFNVKGEDLLFLDQPNIRLTADDRGRYERSACRPEPFASVAVYAPPRRDDPNAGARRVEPPQRRARLLLDARGVLRRGAAAVRLRRRRGRAPAVHDGGAQRHRPAGARRQARRDDGAWSHRRRTVLRTFEDLVDLVVDRVTDEDTDGSSGPAGPSGMGTINAFVRRLPASVAPAWPRSSGPTSPAGRAHRINTSDAQVTVVDLHNLHDRAQRFVVGVTLRKAFDDKERAGTPARCSSWCSTS